MRRTSRVGSAAILAASWIALPALAASGAEQAAYQEFKRAQCHGADARTPAKGGISNIAGLDHSYLVRKTKQAVGEMSHADTLAGGCGEPPNDAQISSIADWVGRLPR